MVQNYVCVDDVVKDPVGEISALVSAGEVAVGVCALCFTDMNFHLDCTVASGADRVVEGVKATVVSINLHGVAFSDVLVVASSVLLL